VIDPSKTYRTRDGREVRIYAVDGYGHYPVHGAYNLGDNDWQACCWTETGCANHREFIPAIDLIEVRPRIQREVWVNVYADDVGAPCNSKDEADQVWRLSGRIACVKLTIDCEEGEGL
jgi:hypothetical protein